MYRITFFFVFLLPIIHLNNLDAFPIQSRPIMIIDCGKKNGIFNEECFKWIQFATDKLSQSGNFLNVRSISNNSFLYRLSDQVYTTTFSEQNSYKNNQVRKFFLNEYRSEAILLMDNTLRYALVYSSDSGNTNINCSVCLEIKDTLYLSRLKSWYIFEKDFSGIKAQYFPFNGPLTIEFYLDQSLPINNISVFNYIYSLQQKLYALKNMRLIFSPVNIYSFLNSALNFKENSPQKRWQNAVSMWELSGERRSSYLDLEKNSLYMDLYTASLSPEIIKSIKETVRSSDKNILNWSIYQNGIKIFSKMDDN